MTKKNRAIEIKTKIREKGGKGDNLEIESQNKQGFMRIGDLVKT